MFSVLKRLFWNTQRISWKFSGWIFLYLWLYCRSCLWDELKGGSGLWWIITNSALNQVLTFTCCALCRPSFTPRRGTISPILPRSCVVLLWERARVTNVKATNKKMALMMCGLMPCSGTAVKKSFSRIPYAEFPLMIAKKWQSILPEYLQTS